MGRVVRGVVATIVAAAALLIVAPGGPAQADGPERALQAICEQVEGGEWTAERVECFKGLDRSVSVAAEQLCNNTIGELLRFINLPPGQPATFGWHCRPS